jgi:predicted anti-sigma-YlaC factor YlaD
MSIRIRSRERALLWIGRAVPRFRGSGHLGNSRLGVIALAVLLAAGCSIQQIAINRLGDALAKEGDAFASDDDPELVGDAIPFSLKLVESLLAESPKHEGLLLAAARGFTQYSYGWVQENGEEIREADPARSAYQQERARRFYFRARNYGMRGLEVAHPGFEGSLRQDSGKAVRLLARGDVPLLYWTAASWGLAISLSREEPDIVADLPLVEAMVDRALELDEGFDHGAIHSIMIVVEVNRPGGQGDPVARARKHFDRAVELSNGMLASPFVTFAEAVSLPAQNRPEFESLLHRALAVDVNARPQWRLENRISQQRAQWLLAHVDDLFLGEAGEKQ